MITNIVTYIGSYDNVRAATGFRLEELPDTALALSLYKNFLNQRLVGIVGNYGSVTNGTLVDIFDTIDSSDDMYGLIQQISIFTVAERVLLTAGLTAFKTASDGKSTLTRFSPESTYLSTLSNIRLAIKELLNLIYQALGQSVVGGFSPLTVVPPAVNLVTGE